jgi:hypothetical protein
MFSLMMFGVNNPDNFQTNSVVHGMNTTGKHQLHTPAVNLSSDTFLSISQITFPLQHQLCHQQ